MTRSEAIDQMKAIWLTLNADLDAALAYGRQGDTPYAERALVRAHFALVEGLSYQLRQVTIASLEMTTLLSAAELTLLKEQRHSVDDKGRPKTSEQYLSFPQSLLFSIHCYVKNHGATFQANTADGGWAAMQDATKIRNRVTHPKSAHALVLSEDDRRLFIQAAAWWKRTMLSMFIACEEADAFWRNELAR